MLCSVLILFELTKCSHATLARYSAAVPDGTIASVDGTPLDQCTPRPMAGGKGGAIYAK